MCNIQHLVTNHTESRISQERRAALPSPFTGGWLHMCSSKNALLTHILSTLFSSTSVLFSCTPFGTKSYECIHTYVQRQRERDVCVCACIHADQWQGKEITKLTTAAVAKHGPKKYTNKCNMIVLFLCMQLPFFLLYPFVRDASVWFPLSSKVICSMTESKGFWGLISASWLANHILSPCQLHKIQCYVTSL